MFLLDVASTYVGLFHQGDTGQQGAQSLGGLVHRQWGTCAHVDLTLPSGRAADDCMSLTRIDDVFG